MDIRDEIKALINECDRRYGKPDPVEEWRREADERAAELADKRELEHGRRYFENLIAVERAAFERRLQEEHAHFTELLEGVVVDLVQQFDKKLDVAISEAIENVQRNFNRRLENEDEIPNVLAFRRGAA